MATVQLGPQKLSIFVTVSHSICVDRSSKQTDMADGGRSVLFATSSRSSRISSTSSPAPRSGWTSVRFGPRRRYPGGSTGENRPVGPSIAPYTANPPARGPPASRRESPAPRSGARNLEVGGRGGTGWRQRRPPAEGAGNERRSRWRSRSRAISCTCAKVTPQPGGVGSSGLLRGELH